LAFGTEGALKVAGDHTAIRLNRIGMANQAEFKL
jgi:hypothetical protein